MHSIPPGEISGMISPLHHFENNEGFTEAIPVLLNTIDPLADLSGIGKKHRKRRLGEIDQRKSFEKRKTRTEFYNSLTDKQIDQVIDYLLQNNQEERFMHLFESVSQDVQIRIIKNMLNLAFNTRLVSYTKEVASIRRKIAKGYVKPARDMHEAEISALAKNYMEAVLYLNEDHNRVDDFYRSFQSDPEVISRILREILKWVPKGEYLTH